jgi:plastocyanin
MKKRAAIKTSLARVRPAFPAAAALLLGLAGVMLWAAAPLDPLPAPFFSLDILSPTIGASPADADDVLSPGPVVVIDGLADLGLGVAGDDLDAVSDNVPDPGSATFLLMFSVDRFTIGFGLTHPALVAAGIPYNAADQAARRQAAGDVFASGQLFSFGAHHGRSRDLSGNFLTNNQFNEGGTSLQLDPESEAHEYNVDPEDAQDDTNAMEGERGGGGSGLRGGSAIYFSLTSSSPSLDDWQPGSGADLFFNPSPGQPDATEIYADYAELGLSSVNDDIDAVIVFDMAGNGAFEEGDRVLFSLAPGSPSLATIPGGAADVFMVVGTLGGPPTPTLFAPAPALGLGHPSGVDNIDALDLLLCADALDCAQQHGIRRYRGDYDNDGIVGPTDLDDFQTCMRGPNRPLDADGPAMHTVSVETATGFSPRDLVIETNDTVRWASPESGHNVVSGHPGFPDEHFDSGDPAAEPGIFFQFHFSPVFLSLRRMPGNAYAYFCEAHGATGTVIVVPPPCEIFDLDRDVDVDLADFEDLQRRAGSP